MSRTFTSLFFNTILALFTTSVSAQIVTTPPGLNPGDPYRLVFITSTTRNATSANINDYDTFVQNHANNSPTLQVLGATWKAIASTKTSDARVTTGTDYTAEVGVPIYRLDGVKVADNYADLWNSSIDAPINVTESGSIRNNVSVWAGTLRFGLRWQYNGYLGGLCCRYTGYGNSSRTDTSWVQLNSNQDLKAKQSLYAISSVLTVTALSPAADAGIDQNVDEGVQVTLDGSASINTTNYAWVQLAGPPVTLSDATAVNPGFTAPYVGVNSTLTFELTVDDGAGNFSQPDTVSITVKSINNPPVANAGDDSTAKEGSIAMLDGGSSFDPENDSPLGYTWSQTAGPPVTLDPGDTSVDPTFLVPLGVGSVLTFELVVDDGLESSDPDEVSITVVANTAPAANAGPDQTIDEGSVFSLDGTASFDPDMGDSIGYAWTGSLAMDDSASATPSSTAPAVMPGGEEFYFDLVVTDDDPINPKSSLADQVKISVRNINDPPSCDLARAVCSGSNMKNNDGCTLWPPNHKMVPVSIAGVMDADSLYNTVTLEITGVTQDEPTDGLGDGDTSPDAVIQADSPADSVLLRAERSGQDDGRVYSVHFIADDGFESCTGSVKVGVPHDRKDNATDSGQSFDSTQP